MIISVGFLSKIPVTRFFPAVDQKKIWFPNRLKRPKMRFSAPQVPKFFEIVQIIQNTPLLITIWKQDDILNKNPIDRKTEIWVSEAVYRAGS